jgi:hypothetical protein
MMDNAEGDLALIGGEEFLDGRLVFGDAVMFEFVDRIERAQ